MFEWLLNIPMERLAEADGWRIDFVADYDNYQKLLLVLAFAALAVLVVHCYRREGQAPRSSKLMLGGLRLAALLLVALAVLRPAIKLRFVNTIHSKVVVLVDDSRSMSFIDRYEDVEQRKKLSEFLGISEDDLGTMSRRDVLTAALSRSDGTVARLLRDHPVEFMAFSPSRTDSPTYTRELGTIPMQPSALTDALPPGMTEAMKGLSAAGAETDIARSLRDVLAHVQGQQVAGVVVVTDGQMTADDAAGRLAGAAEFARQRGGGAVPVYFVGVGDTVPPRNVAVGSLQGPREVRRKETPELTVVLTHRNAAGREVTIKLRRRPADGETWTDLSNVTQAVLRAPEKTEDPNTAVRQDVTIEIQPDDVGEWIYQATVDPLADEVNTADNSAEVAIRVSQAKIRILIVAGDAGWEFQYLRNFLLRASDAYEISIWQQNADVDVNQAASSPRMKLSRLPKDLEQLIGSSGGKPHPGYDLVVLMDPQPTQGGFDEAFVKMLKAFVETHGKGLCYVSGRKYTVDLMLGQGTYKPLRDLLPVSITQNAVDLAERLGTRRPTAWPMHLTLEGRDHPIMRLGGSDKETLGAWASLPGVYWSQAVRRVKPGARKLAEHSNTRRLVAEGGREELEPLVAVQPVGKGRVVFLGTNETWRWRFVRDGHYHRRFWANVIRYLATLDTQRVTITTGGDRFDVGSSVTVRAQAFDKQYRPLRAETIEIIYRRLGADQPGSVTLKAVEGKEGLYEGAFEPDRTGTYVLTAKVDDADADDAVAEKRIQVQVPQAEARRVEADHDVLKRVASPTGRFMPIWDIARLTEHPRLRIPEGRLRNVRERPYEIWDTPAMLIALLLLLTVEWVFRKLRNMA